MIAYVKGTLESIETDAVVIDVGGIGFRVYTPINESVIRTGIGGELLLHTYMNVREDAMVLYGFTDKETLELFSQLISVTGVGPRSALQILSSISAADLISAIARDDRKALTKVNGIGAKTAARIVLDLKDKVGTIQISGGDAENSLPAAVVMKESGPAQEAVEALISLGFSQSEAEKAVARTAAEGMDVNAILKQSLKVLY